MPQDIRAKSSDRILKEYNRRLKVFTDATDAAARLLNRVLLNQPINSITSRVKAAESVRKKVADKGYSSLADFTDICGVRVITYFADDAEKLAEVISSVFRIDRENSRDVLDRMSANQFGYRSIHLIGYFSKRRTILDEYKNFADVPVEIQVRSILQDAWAEIEHDRGYKTSDGVPLSVRRRLARLAGLLELGDSEFEQIRNRINAEKTEMLRKIKFRNSPVLIDKDSLGAFVLSSSELKRLDGAIGKAARLPVIYSDSFIETFVARLKDVGFSTIGEIEKDLHNKIAVVRRFGVAWFQTERGKKGQLVPRGFGLSLLALMAVLDAGGEVAMVGFLKKHAFNKKLDQTDTAQHLAAAYKQAKEMWSDVDTVRQSKKLTRKTKEATRPPR